MKKTFITVFMMVTWVWADPRCQGALDTMDNVHTHSLAEVIFLTTFATTSDITTQVSSCDQPTSAMNPRAIEFASANRAQLAREIAMGQGESVETLAELLDVLDRHAFALALQARYHTLYPTSDVPMGSLLDGIAATVL